MYSAQGNIGCFCIFYNQNTHKWLINQHNNSVSYPLHLQEKSTILPSHKIILISMCFPNIYEKREPKKHNVEKKLFQVFTSSGEFWEMQQEKLQLVWSRQAVVRPITGFQDKTSIHLVTPLLTNSRFTKVTWQNKY